MVSQGDFDIPALYAGIKFYTKPAFSAKNHSSYSAVAKQTAFFRLRNINSDIKIKQK